MAAHRSKRRRFAPSIALIAGVMSWMLMGVQTADAARLVNLTLDADNLPIGVTIDVVVDATFCDNKTSEITINGNAVIASIGMDVRFRNQVQNENGKWVKVEGSLDLTLDPSTDVTPGSGGYWNQDGSYTIPKQPPLGGVGGNPWISFDPDGRDNPNTLFQEGGQAGFTILGRCVQGNRWGIHGGPFNIENFADGLLGQVACDTNSSTVDVDARAGAPNGLRSSVVFDNNKNYAVHWDQAASKWDFNTAPGWEGFHKGWGNGGVGGNPNIDARFYARVWNDDGDHILEPLEMTRLTPYGTGAPGEGNGNWSSSAKCKSIAPLPTP